MKGVSIVVPPDTKPGQRITANSKDGVQLETIVPSDAKGGDEIPARKVVQAIGREEVSTAGRSYDDDDSNSFNCLGRLNSYCLFFFALSSFVMCLSLLQSVSWDYSGIGGDCYWQFGCCEASCEAYCYSEVCTSGL
uniref:Uncharacterized protein n=1 Tax=Chrysotila carterae TaxID=13221 RepID=A0A7S4B1S1_CHRCT